MKKEKAINFSKTRLLINFFISIMFFIFSLLMLSVFELKLEFSYEAVAVSLLIFSLIFWGWFTYFFIIRLIKDIPALIISEEGIIDQSSLFGANMVLWGDLKGFLPYKYKGQILWGFVLDDPLKYVNSLPILKKIMVKPNLRLGLPHFSIPMKHLAVSEEELNDILSEFIDVTFYVQEDK